MADNARQRGDARTPRRGHRQDRKHGGRLAGLATNAQIARRPGRGRVREVVDASQFGQAPRGPGGSRRIEQRAAVVAGARRPGEDVVDQGGCGGTAGPGHEHPQQRRRHRTVVNGGTPGHSVAPGATAATVRSAVDSTSRSPTRAVGRCSSTASTLGRRAPLPRDPLGAVAASASPGTARPRGSCCFPPSSITSRSMPIPMPPVGGIPCSSART